MLRGFLGGVLSGAVVSGVVLGGLSLLTEVPRTGAPEAAALEVPAGSEFNQSREDTEASLPSLEATPIPDAIPEITAPEPDDLSSLQGAANDPVSEPVAGGVETGLTAPETQAASGMGADGGEEPVLPNPQALPPEVPETEEALSISTEPAQPAQPEVADDQGAFTEAAPEPQPAPEAPATPEPEPETETGAATPEDSAPQAEEPDAAEAEPSGTIGNLAQGVTTDRLPSVNDAPEPEPAEPATVAAEASDGDAMDEDTRPPIERFAAEFENPEGKPLMAIVLIDDGTSPIGPNALADFPYPISFAVDAAHPDAAQRAAAYRAAGMEVLTMVDLPDTATARDAEVAMATYLATVPEAVAVMEGTGTGLQASREAAEQLAPILLDSGHGLVMFPQGLNTVQKLISREGVPSASVFRDFDASGLNAAAIRRFLDQGAFKAGQEEGGVVMLGRLRPDTISALLLWGLQDRASSVALAPVSAVLTSQ